MLGRISVRELSVINPKSSLCSSGGHALRIEVYGILRHKLLMFVNTFTYTVQNKKYVDFPKKGVGRCRILIDVMPQNVVGRKTQQSELDGSPDVPSSSIDAFKGLPVEF